MATYTQTRWSLADLFSARDGQDMQQAFAGLESGVARFETRRSQLTPEMLEADFSPLSVSWKNSTARRSASTISPP